MNKRILNPILTFALILILSAMLLLKNYAAVYADNSVFDVCGFIDGIVPFIIIAFFIAVMVQMWKKNRNNNKKSHEQTGLHQNGPAVYGAQNDRNDMIALKCPDCGVTLSKTENITKCPYCRLALMKTPRGLSE